MFEVQTNTVCDGWINCWTWTDWDNVEAPQLFDTHDLAMAAIHEFFADLYRAGMGHAYDIEDYRVVPADA
jgi:hypothetical protein